MKREISIGTVLLAAIVVAGAALRLYGLSVNSLWLDEATTLQISSLPFWGIAFADPVHPPLFYWIEHVAVHLFGTTEFGLRLVPALCGILAIPVFYLLGKETDGPATGIIAAGLIAVSPFHIIYSQEARMYSLVLLLVSLAFLFYLRAMNGNTLREWALFGLFSALSVWTHYYTFLIIGVIFLHAIIIAGRRQKYRGLVLSLLFFTTGTVPLAIPVLALIRTRSSIGSVFGVQGWAMLDTTLQHLAGYGFVTVLICLVAYVLGTVAYSIENKEKGLLLMMGFAIPLAVSVLLSEHITMVPRYLIWLLPFFLIPIAYAGRIIYEGMPKVMGFRPVATAMLVLLLCTPLAPLTTGTVNTDWRGFSDTLTSLTEPGDQVIVMPGYTAKVLGYYYDNETDGTILSVANNLTDLQAVALEQKDCWIVTSVHLQQTDDNGAAYEYLENTTKIIDGDPLSDVVLYHERAMIP